MRIGDHLHRLAQAPSTAAFLADTPPLVLVEVEAAQGDGDVAVTARLTSASIQHQTATARDARVVPLAGPSSAAGAAGVLVGRGPHCQLVVDHASVSKEHARVHVPDGPAADAPQVEDLGSTNGTFVDGLRLAPHVRHALAPDHTVRFGRGALFQVLDAKGLLQYLEVLRRFGI